MSDADFDKFCAYVDKVRLRENEKPRTKILDIDSIDLLIMREEALWQMNHHFLLTRTGKSNINRRKTLKKANSAIAAKVINFY